MFDSVLIFLKEIKDIAVFFEKGMLYYRCAFG